MNPICNTCKNESISNQAGGNTFFVCKSCKTEVYSISPNSDSNRESYDQANKYPPGTIGNPNGGSNTPVCIAGSFAQTQKAAIQGISGNFGGQTNGNGNGIGSPNKVNIPASVIMNISEHQKFEVGQTWEICSVNRQTGELKIRVK